MTKLLQNESARMMPRSKRPGNQFQIGPEGCSTVLRGPPPV